MHMLEQGTDLRYIQALSPPLLMHQRYGAFYWKEPTKD